MKLYLIKTTTLILFCAAVFVSDPVQGQQFSSDSYISKPHGMATVIMTAGERNIMTMTTFSLFPRWEFTFAAYIYRDDRNSLTDDGYSTSIYAKYMFYENAAKTGGFAMKAGRGLDPGYLDGEQKVKDATKTFWMNAPATIPFFDNKLSWDIMPGATVNRNYGEDDQTAWGFTYSTRLAWYPFNYEWALVGEVFGTAGDVTAIPEYKIGVRWEPNQNIVYALTYGQEFSDNKGAGAEFGIMIFTPPFLKLKWTAPWKKTEKAE